MMPSPERGPVRSVPPTAEQTTTAPTPTHDAGERARETDVKDSLVAKKAWEDSEHKAEAEAKLRQQLEQHLSTD